MFRPASVGRVLPLLFLTVSLLFAAVPAEAASGPSPDQILHPDGVGPVRLGAVISRLPAASEGLYDQLRYVEELFTDEGAYEEIIGVYKAFNQGMHVLTIHPGEDGTVSTIEIFSRQLKNELGQGLSSTAATLFAAGAIAELLYDGGVGLICGSMLFCDIPLSAQGVKKAEDAYLGYEVSFDTSDFTQNGHPGRILLSEYYSRFAPKPATVKKTVPANDSSDSDSSEEGFTHVLFVIIYILFLVSFFAAIIHMVYVAFFQKKLPEWFYSSDMPSEDDALVSQTLDELQEQFKPFCKKGTQPGADTLYYPASRKVVNQAYQTLKKFSTSHRPFSKETAAWMGNMAQIVNQVKKRHFTGSIVYLSLSLVFILLLVFLGDSIRLVYYIILSSAVYILSCRTPLYVLMRRACRGQDSASLFNKILGSIMGGAFDLPLEAPIIRTTWYVKDTGKIVKQEDDHTLEVLGLLLGFFIASIMVFAMLPIAVLNYIRNYWLR